MNVNDLIKQDSLNVLGMEVLRYLKEVAGVKGPQLGLKVKGYEGYFIRPIPTKFEFIKPSDVLCLTDWRNRYRNSFLTDFLATKKQTFEWLREKVHVDNSRMLFMLENSRNEQVGYLGLGFIDWERSYVEADSIVSGGETPKGLMTAALKTLLLWARGQLGLNRVGVRVLSDNTALYFYQKMGFLEVKRVPLRRILLDDVVTWIEDDLLSVSERYLVYCVWSENEL